jgi:hypothetical protein
MYMSSELSAVLIGGGRALDHCMHEMCIFMNEVTHLPLCFAALHLT